MSIVKNRIYIERFSSDLYAGNYVEFKTRHCQDFQPYEKSKFSTAVGRISSANSRNDTVKVQLYIHADDIPSTSKTSLPVLQHTHLHHMKELIEIKEEREIQTSEILRLAFVFPAIKITEENSSFHPQGMLDYYIIRFYYCFYTNR